MTTARRDLDKALERVACRYAALPENARPDVVGPEWLLADRTLDLAFVSGDDLAASRAVSTWERRVTQLVESFSRRIGARPQQGTSG